MKSRNRKQMRIERIHELLTILALVVKVLVALLNRH